MQSGRGAAGAAGYGGRVSGGYGAELAVVTVAADAAVVAGLSAALGDGHGDEERAGPTDVVVALLGGGGAVPDGAGARRLRTLAIPERVTVPAALNRAIAGLPERIGWLVLARGDARPGPGSLGALRAAARRHPRAGAVGPRIVPAGTAEQSPAGSGVRSERGVRARPGRLADRLAAAVVERARPDPAPGAGEEPVTWLPATFLLVRRAAFDSVEGYDLRIPEHLADLDLGIRLNRAGWLVVQAPQVAVAAGPAPVPRTDGAARYLATRSRGDRRDLLRAALGRMAAR